jgi:DNA repair protein RadC
MNLPKPVVHLEKDARMKILEGSSSLEDFELISILLGSGSRELDVYSLSREFLLSIGGLERLVSIVPSHIPPIKGLGPARKAALLALGELVRRIRKKSLESSSQPFPILEIYNTLWVLTERECRESFYLVNLSLDGRIQRLERIAQGSLNEVGIHKRDLVQLVLQDSSGYTLLAHNHPKQPCLPSAEDQFLYEEMSRLFSELEIQCIDHWVLGVDGLYSCRWDKVLEPLDWRENFIPSEYDFLDDIYT